MLVKTGLILTGIILAVTAYVSEGKQQENLISAAVGVTGIVVIVEMKDSLKSIKY